jgi:hypothetical protein
MASDLQGSGASPLRAGTNANALDINTSARKESPMTRFKSIAMALLLGASCSEGQVNRTPGRVPAGAPLALPVVITAQDATYTVALPPGWRPMVRPMLEYGLFWGTEGESFAVGMEDVYLDPRMLKSILDPGYRAILPPAQFILKSRMVAPPMSPLEVVTRLLPQLAGGPGGAIQNLRVVRTFRGAEGFGFSQMLIIYQYTFLPQRDPAFASQAHPAVRAQTQTAMRAAAYVITFPYMPGQFSWAFGYRILSVPQNVFPRNAGTYAQIFQSFRVIPEGLKVKVKTNEDMKKLCDSMNQTTRQMAQAMSSQLGAGTEPALADYQRSQSTESAKDNPRPAVNPDFACYGSNPCGPNDVTYCCQGQGGATHFKCLPRSKDLPHPGYASPNETNCKQIYP